MAKKIKVLDQNVLEVLSGLQVEGQYVRIGFQLDRKMYTRVNEVLETLGGKWHRQGNGHLFPSEVDVQERIDEVLTTGSFEIPSSLDYFATPEATARLVVAQAELAAGMEVLEPSAGSGALIVVMLSQVPRLTVHAIEIESTRMMLLRKRFGSAVHVRHGDFMRMPPPPLVDRVVMNPPFTKVFGADCIDHVIHAAAQLKRDGVLISVLPASVSFRQDTRHRYFRDWYKSYKGRLTDLPAGSFKASGTNVNTVLLKLQNRKRGSS